MLQHQLADAWHDSSSSAASTTSTTTTYLLLRLYCGFYALSILASLWVYCVARRLAPGAMRAAACAPVVLLQLAVTPLLVDRLRTPVLIVPVCGTLSLAAFKVAAYAMGRGPLAMQHCGWTQNLLQFGVVLSLPVIPRDAFKLGAGASLSDVSSQPPATWPTFLKLYAQKAGAATVAASLAIWPALPELVRHWFYALCLSLTLGALWDFWCCVAVAFAGIPVAPSFDKPWLSTSFADYWSRRWNLTTAYLLRVLIYEPVREGRCVPLHAACPAASDTAHGAAAQQQPSSTHTTPQATAAAPAGPLAEEDDDDAAGAVAAGSKDRPSGLVRRSVHITASSSLSSTNGGSMLASSQAPLAAAAAAEEEERRPLTTGSSSRSRRPQETPAQAILRRVAATSATFVFSGLWHMLIFYYATGLVTHHWLLFFSLQGPVMVAETLLKHHARAAGLRLPHPVSVLLTNFLLIVIARPLFFGPCDWSGLCSAMMSNVKGGSVGGAGGGVGAA